MSEYNKHNIIHIHSDLKFIHDVDRYNHKQFFNTLIIIGDKRVLKEQYNNIALFFPQDNNNIEEIVTICKTADLIIINSLDNFKIKIVLALPNNIKVGWRFFGFELYDKRKYLFLSNKTKKIFSNNLKSILKFYKKKFEVIAETDIFPKLGIKSPFIDAVERINFILCICEDEFNLLQNLYSSISIPSFVKIPIISLQNITNDDIPIKKSNMIILGNSRSFYNNHIDLLDNIRNSSSNYGTFKMLFSYGDEDLYTKKIREVASTSSNIEIIEDFMEMNEFYKLYKSSKAFIHNGYRQMAMGNIFAALNSGVKVYLTDQNVLKEWFLKNDILIFSIKNFIRDYENNDIELTQEQIANNRRSLKIMIENFPIKVFHDKILQIINKE